LTFAKTRWLFCNVKRGALTFEVRKPKSEVYGVCGVEQVAVVVLRRWVDIWHARGERFP
jgi:hypothetical protein